MRTLTWMGLGFSGALLLGAAAHASGAEETARVGTRPGDHEPGPGRLHPQVVMAMGCDGRQSRPVR